MDDSFISVRDEALSLMASSLYDPDHQLQVIAVEGYSKLLLHRIINSVEVIQGLLQLYLHPSTAANVRLRQALTYFLQAFAFSRPQNQCLLAQAVVPVLKTTLSLAEHLVLTPLQLGLQLLDLCDPTHLINNASTDEWHAPSVLAESLAWSAMESLEDPSQLRLFTQLLTRMPLTASWPPISLKRLLLITGQLVRVLPASEKALVAAIKKMIALLVEFDDVSLSLDPADLEQLKERLQSLHLPLISQSNQSAQSVAIKKKTTAASNKMVADANIMDEITDLLED